MSNYYPNRDMLWSGFPTNWSLLKRLMWVRIMRGGGTPPEYLTVTGNPVTFETVRPAKLRQLSVAFSPVQSGTGDPSPDNVRPISGWDSLNVWQTGKNIYDRTLYPLTDGQYINGTTGEVASNASYSATLGYIPCWEFAGQALTLNKRPGGANPGIAFYSANSVSTFISGVRNSSGTAGTPITFTVPESARYMRFCTVASASDVQIELGSAASEYQPYTGRSISITLGQTVYSGTVDVLTGVGEVTMAHLVFDGTDMSAIGMADTSTAGYKRLNIGIGAGSASRPQAKVLPNSSVVQNMFCNILPVKSGDQVYLRTTGIGTPRGGNSISAYHPDYQTVEAWQALFEETPMTVAYELETPIPISLTPQEVQSLAGDNVLFSDANGDLTVEYRSN